MRRRTASSVQWSLRGFPTDRYDRYADADVAMDGYCPVCKIEMGKDVKGQADFAADYKGMRYLFPGKKQLDMFKSNPIKYAAK